MKSLKLDRVVGKRADKRNEYLKIKPEHPANRNKFVTDKPGVKKNKNIKQGKWKY